MKRFSRSSPKRLLRVCDVVREKLGLDALCCEYSFPARQASSSTRLADAGIYYSGWRCEIVFYPFFFVQPLHRQLETVVHEHLHVLMHPLDQFITRWHDQQHRSKRAAFDEAAHVARELTVEHATGPMLRLLRPHINKVL